MDDTDSLKDAFVSAARSACDITESLMKASAPYKDQDAEIARFHLHFEAYLQSFRRFKTGFERFILQTPDKNNTITRDRILVALSRIRANIETLQKNEGLFSTFLVSHVELVEDLLCAPEMFGVIAVNLINLKGKFKWAAQAIGSDEATLKLAKSKEATDFLDIISHEAQQGYSPPLKLQGLGDMELWSNDAESSGGKATVHEAAELDLPFDSEYTVPEEANTEPIISGHGRELGSKDNQYHLSSTDYLFSDIEMWKTSRPKRNHADELGTDQSRDLTMDLARIGSGEEEAGRVAALELGITWPSSWDTKSIEEDSEGYESFDPDDVSNRVVETCKLCNKMKLVEWHCPKCAGFEPREVPMLLPPTWMLRESSSEDYQRSTAKGNKEAWQNPSETQGHASEAAGSLDDSDKDSTKAEDSESDTSNPPSVFSLATLPSTIMTTDTRLTVDEMQTAIEELVGIFFDDTEMTGLYEKAIVEREVSLERFVRNFRRLLKQFALNLKEEAREAIELDLSKLILMRARLIADKIGNKLELKYLNEPPTHLPLSPFIPLRTPSVTESFKLHIMAQPSLPEGIIESSSDEDEEPAETFTALVSHGRDFILESAAIKNLQKDLANFIFPDGPMVGADIKLEFGISKMRGGIVFRRSTRLWGFPLIDMAATRARFRARGMERYWYWNKFFQLCQVEEDLPEKHTRFRWTNVSLFSWAILSFKDANMSQRHGKNLYDDYVEHEPGALQALQEFLKATTVPTYIVAKGTEIQGSSSAAARYTPNSGGLQATPCASTPQGGGNVTQSAITTPGGQPAIASQHIGTGIQESRPLLLLCCIERRGRPIKLHQEYVTQITDDRQLFHALRKIYFSHRRKFESFWSLRKLHSIHFMKTFAVIQKSASPANPAPAFHHQPSSHPWAQPINADQSPRNTPHQSDPA
ncbi:hypothetical protein PENSUB_1036 [Penicillium subrubescens]|uniref:Uncharacterized protein n=1 Tax=Penicillium subrubescens TaxID=1316194 RepID=A0A1Q5ULD4_9EURO|nr:hypothetical protein PENSUB_1036 [Penicillium subrubescens]